MSRPRWNDEQAEALNARGCEILVSAGAGAGKTAVLTERVLRMLTAAEQPVPVERLLVVTFTEAAAAEMKERIGSALQQRLAAAPDDPWLQRQAAYLPQAQISTIHSFCLHLVRRHFHRLGLDPGFRLLDDQETKLLRYEVYEQVIERLLAEADDPAFLTLLEEYGGFDGSALQQPVFALDDLAATQVDPDGWLDGLVAMYELAPDADPDHIPWLQVLRQAFALKLEQAVDLLKAARECSLEPGGPDAYAGLLERERAACEAALAALPSTPWPELGALIGAIEFARLPQQRGEADEALKQQAKDLRDKAKAVLKEIAAWVEPPPQALLSLLASLKRPVAALVKLVRNFREQYEARKQTLAVLDFNDLERYALRLLSEDAGGTTPAALARSLYAFYHEVIVDEYQDINPLQEALLSLIGGHVHGRSKRFLVGDVKQSIYRFRLAEPSIFLERYRAYGGEDDAATPAAGRPATPAAGAEDRPGRVIDLFKNYRSRPNVLAAVNHVFRQLFPNQVGGMAYGARQMLRAGNDFPDADPPVELHVIEKDNAILTEKAKKYGLPVHTVLTLSAEQREALLIAERIRALLGAAGEPPLQVWDAKTERFRPLRFGDIAVLLRSPGRRANQYVDILAQCGIPAQAELSKGYFGATEVTVLLSLLQALDNPEQDIPLAAVMHSEIGGFSAHELAAIRLAGGDGPLHQACRAAVQAPPDEAALLTPALQKRLARFLDTLDDWRTQARRRPLSDLIWRILQESGYLDVVSVMPGGAQRRANLEQLLNLASAFDHFARPGLQRFLRFCERMQAQGEDFGEALPAQGGTDAVQIMSIHKSKGLEFPVVFLADLGHEFNLTDVQQPILLHRRLGIGPRKHNAAANTYRDTPARAALAHRLKVESLAEEMRVLYVAMTRAQERLIMIGSRSDLDKTLQNLPRLRRDADTPLPAATVLDASCLLDWLLACFVPALRPGGQARPDLNLHVDVHDADAVLRRLTLPGAGAKQADSAVPAAQAEPLPPIAAQAAAMPEDVPSPDAAAATDVEPASVDFDRRFALLRQRDDGGRLAAKVSVSELKRWLEQAEQAIDTEDAGEPLFGGPPSQTQQAWEPARPRFIQEAAVDRADAVPDPHAVRAPAMTRPSAPELGSVVHRFLQGLDLARPLDVADLKAQWDAMAATGIVPAAFAEAMPLREIAHLFTTPLGQALVRAYRDGTLLRERPFSMRVPARRLYPDAVLPGRDDWVLVQGMFDALIVEADGVVLIDFKTDRVHGPALEQRAAQYRRQLAAYAEAATAMFERPLRRASLYFLLARQERAFTPGELQR